MARSLYAEYLIPLQISFSQLQPASFNLRFLFLPPTAQSSLADDGKNDLVAMIAPTRTSTSTLPAETLTNTTGSIVG